MTTRKNQKSKKIYNKFRKTRRHPIGNYEKEVKRLQAQRRRFKIAKGDKRFKETKGLIKWSRPSKTKGKKRSRRIYHRKRK